MPKFNRNAAGENSRERFSSIMEKFKKDTASGFKTSKSFTVNDLRVPKFQKIEDVYRHFGIPENMPLAEKAKIIRQLRARMENNTFLIVTEHANLEAKLKSQKRIDPFSDKYINPKDVVFFGRNEAKEINDFERQLGIDPSLPADTKDRMMSQAATEQALKGKQILFARKATKNKPVSEKVKRKLL